MNTVADNPRRGPPAGAGVRKDLWQRLLEAELAASRADAANAERAEEEHAAAWLALQCSVIPDARQGVVVMGEPDTGPFAPTAFWPPDSAPSQTLADAADRALAEREPLFIPAGEHGATAALVCPILVEGRLYGLAAIETASAPESALGEWLRALQGAVQGMVAAVYRSQRRADVATQEHLVATLDLVAAALTEERFLPAAHALATDLALRLECDRVSIGFRRGGHCDVVALSHSALFGKRMDLVRLIGTAMDEAIDQRSTIEFPAGKDEVLVVRDHAALARLYGSDSILTVPFVAGEASRGAFTFERPGNRPFDAAAVELAQAVVALCSRMLEAKRLNERSIGARLADAVRGETRRLTGPRHVARKLAAVAAVLLTLFFAVTQMDYRITGNAALEGAVRRVLIAPYDGYVESAQHRAGDVVKAGTVIATLDQRDLRLEFVRWTSQREQFARQYEEAQARHDRAQTSISLAQVQQAQAQMDLISGQLQRASVTAPFDGIIVSGDLTQALGSAVKRGQTLFEVAPLETYRVVMQIDESDVAGVSVGQKGAVVLAGVPGERFPVTISSVTPVSSSREGRTYFRVDAMLDLKSDRMRPGMEGIAKIDAGRRHVIWIWTHRLVDWLRLKLWSWI